MTTADPREIFGDLMDIKVDIDYSVYTPEMIEQEALETKDRLELSPKFIRAAHREWMTRRQEYKQAYALAIQAARANKIPSTERKYEADLDTMDLLRRLDDAKILYDYVQDLEKALSKKLSTLQSVLRSQSQAFGAQR